MNKIVTITTKTIDKLLDKDIIKLYPLDGFSVGYEYTFDIDYIKDNYCLVNRILTTDDINALRLILSNSLVKGIVFDDLGLIEALKSININKILLLDHLANNSISINYYLDYVDSVTVSNDLEYSEIEYILKNTKKELVVNVFGLKRLMYSRRKLLTNYYKYHNLEYNNILDTKIDNKYFKVIENDYGTVFYAYPYYDGLSLMNKDNIKMYFYEPILLSDKDIINVVNNSDVSNIECSAMFLSKKSIYKVGELNG